MSLSLTACVFHTRVPGPVAPAPEAKATPAGLFADVTPPSKVDNHHGDRLPSGHRLRQIRFPSTGDNGQADAVISADYFQSSTEGARPMVIVLPIWGSSTYPPEKITQGILKRLPGLHVYRVHGEEPLLDWEALAAARDDREAEEAIQGLVQRVAVAVRDIRRIAAWAHEQPEIDADRLGLIGFSIGAILGGIAMANEPALHAGVLVMGGARAADIALECGGRRAMARKHVLETLGWSRERYRQALADAFAPIDASYPPGKVDPTRVLIIDSARDDCVPPSSRHALRERMGQPQRITYLYTHAGSFYAMTPLGLNLMRRQIFEFLRKQLGEAV